MTARRIVLYDGVCVFCNGVVRFFLKRDREGRLYFAPLQGTTAERLRRRHPQIPKELETFVYVETQGDEERVFLRSEAFFRLLGTLGPPWRWLALLRLLPRRFADAAYGAFARRRYRWFGQLDACPVPPPAVRERFLD